MRIRAAFVAFVVSCCLPAGAWSQVMSEMLTLPRQHRGKPITLTATLMLPPGAGTVAAMIIQHGSGGVTQGREFRYAREMVDMGVAALVIDSFASRGVKSTVSDQSQVTDAEMTEDVLAGFKALAAHARIDAGRIGIVGFSKGGSVALRVALERYVMRALPTGQRFALHVPFYPGCTTHQYRPKLTGAPIYMQLGGDDTYAGVAPCTEYAAKLKAGGATIEVKIYPGAKHGFDTDTAYAVASGENWSRCIFEEQSDGTWKERISGATVANAKGEQIVEGRKRALAACRTLGVSGGPNPSARAQAMQELKALVRRHLLRAD